MAKLRYNFSISTEALLMLRKLAIWDNRPVSNYLEATIREKYQTAAAARGTQEDQD